jgi:uncharacterized protein (TIGR02145 family)
LINKNLNIHFKKGLFWLLPFLFFFTFLISQNTIESIKIGNQEWMSSNLNVITFRNGDTIPLAKTNEEWESAGENGQPAWCYYESNSQNGEKYGKLYNWYAVNDSRGLAPNGWHIATDKEWKILSDFLGGEKVSGEKLKSKEGWNNFKGKGICNNCKNWSSEYRAGNTCTICKDKRKILGEFSGNGTDEVAFKSLPSGYRFGDGYFSKIGEFSGWWTSTDGATHYTWARSIISKGKNIYRTFYDKEDGLSIRCVKD